MPFHSCLNEIQSNLITKELSVARALTKCLIDSIPHEHRKFSPPARSSSLRPPEANSWTRPWVGQSPSGPHRRPRPPPTDPFLGVGTDLADDASSASKVMRTGASIQKDGVSLPGGGEPCLTQPHCPEGDAASWWHVSQVRDSMPLEAPAHVEMPVEGVPCRR